MFVNMSCDRMRNSCVCETVWVWLRTFRWRRASWIYNHLCMKYEFDFVSKHTKFDSLSYNTAPKYTCQYITLTLFSYITYMYKTIINFVIFCLPDTWLYFGREFDLIVTDVPQWLSYQYFLMTFSLNFRAFLGNWLNHLATFKSLSV